METTEIFEKVKTVFVEEFEIEKNLITEESLIFDDLGLDSLDIVDLIVALEKAFDFKVDRRIDGAVITKIKNIQDIINYIESKKP